MTTLNEQAEASPFPNTFRMGVQAAIEVIEQHIPSLTDEDESLIEDHARDWLFPDPGFKSDAADLALRTCHCGVKIDGFYEYVDHLKEVLRKGPP